MLQSTVLNMSFAQEVKKEISNLELSTAAYKAELYGITKLKANLMISLNNFKIEYVTNNNSLTRRIVFLIKRLFPTLEIELFTKEQTKLDFKKLFYVRVLQAKSMLVDLDLLTEDWSFKDDVSTLYHAEKESVLRGMFLAKGSINDPKKSNYHLEIVCNYDSDASYLQHLFSEFGIIANLVERKKGIVVYIKKSEHIGDFLKIIGSTNALFFFENERIKRDLNNVVNRVLNCDIANSDRTQASAQLQLHAIAAIEEVMSLDALSPRLKEAALLRKANPESSLAELSEVSEEVLGRFLSKSGISHCLRDLVNFANGLTDQKDI